MSDPVRSIAVVGGGVTGWAAAAAFATRLPGVAVTVIETPGSPPALADLIGVASPSIGDFHADTRIDEASMMRATDAVFRLGARYEGWSKTPFTSCHGEHGAAMAGAPFHMHWLRFGRSSGEFEDFSPASAMAAAGRFVHPAEDDRSPLSRFGYGLTFDPLAYTELLCTHALDRGARVAAGPARAVLGDSGRVSMLAISGGATVEADLYVYTRGNIVSGAWTDWSHWLPRFTVDVEQRGCDPKLSLPLVEQVRADDAGLTLSIATRVGTTRATARFGGEAAFAPGRLIDSWTGNVVTIGGAAVTLPPLEGISLHLVHAHVDRIVAMLPGRAPAPVEIADYNRQTAEEADRLRDFAVLHFATTERVEPIWQALAASVLPGSLEHDLRLFRARGHLPIHDGESFAPDSWLSVLMGHGITPRRIDPVAAELPEAETRRTLAHLRDAIRSVVGALPTHDAYLNKFLESRS